MAAVAVDESAISGRRPTGWRRIVLVLALLVAARAFALFSPSADAADCAAGTNGWQGDYGYTGGCGPQYETPAWGDAAGWAQPSMYSTIRLADLTGNGQEELLARNDDGLEIWQFASSIGQRRPSGRAWR